MVFKFNACCGCFIGNGRENNEDNFYFNKKHLPIPNMGLKNPIKCSGSTDDPLVFALFDGMGGEACGEDAACLASEVFSREVKKLEELAFSGKEFLVSCCEKANKEVNGLKKEKLVGTMGTTVASLYLSQDEVVSCNVGDSKVFRVRDRQMLSISKDHTDAEIISAMGINKKPVLLQYIGMKDTEMLIEPYTSKGEIKSGDVYLLCTDGVTDVLDINEIYETVCNNDAYEAVKTLLGRVDKLGGADNATVIVIKID